MNEAVTLEIAFRISPLNRDEFLQTLDCLLFPATGSADASAARCFEQIGEKNSFLWHECWKSRLELEDRLKSRGLKTLLGAIGVLGDLERLEVLTADDPQGNLTGEA